MVNPIILGQAGTRIGLAEMLARQPQQQQERRVVGDDPKRQQYGDSARAYGLSEALQPIEVSSGTWGEALAEALAGGLRGRAAQSERQSAVDQEQWDTNREQKQEAGQRTAISEALAGFDPNNPRAMVEILRQGAPEEALGLASALAGRTPQARWEQLPPDQLPTGARFGQQNMTTGQRDFDYAPAPGITLSPEATDFVARQYSQGAEIPSGLSRSGRIGPIIERATQLAAEQNRSPEEVAVNRSTYQANARALRERTSQRAAVHNFERTTLANIELAASLGRQVDRSGVPAVDRWINAGRIATGDPDVAAYHNAITGAMTEYAKVLSGATGSAGVTEGAREEAEAMWNTAHSPEQVERMLQEMRASMHNRVVGMDQEISALQESMRGSGVNEAGEMITELPPVEPPPAEGAGIGAMVGRRGRTGPRLNELSDEELDRLERQLSGAQ